MHGYKIYLSDLTALLTGSLVGTAVCTYYYNVQSNQKESEKEKTRYALHMYEKMETFEFLQHLTTVNDYWKKHGESSPTCFIDDYKSKGFTTPINCSRRFVDQQYRKMKFLYERGLLDDNLIAILVDSGCVENYLERVHRLNTSKPDARTDGDDVMKFWKRFIK